MQGDNGEVLQGLADNWTFCGATIMEWSSGVVMFFIVSLFGRTPATGMPYMISAMILTAYSLAGLRKSFPDEERGVRNALLVSCGFPPRDIPAPAVLQPIWSPAPVRSLSIDCKYVSLGFDKIFGMPDDLLLSPEEGV